MNEICSTYGGSENSYKIFIGKWLARDLRLDEEDNIEIYFMEAEWMGFVWLRIGSNDVCYKHSNEPLGLREKY